MMVGDATDDDAKLDIDGANDANDDGDGEW